MVCSCFPCGYFPNLLRFIISNFLYPKFPLKKRTRPNTCDLDSPTNEAKNSRLKSPQSQNSIAESNCKVLTDQSSSLAKQSSLGVKAAWQFSSLIF